MTTPAEPEERGSPRTQDYLLLALAGLGFVTVVLVTEGLDWWAVLPFAAGVLGLVWPGVVSPSLVLFLVMLLVSLRFRFVGFGFDARPPGLPVVDLLMAVATLVYVIGHTRLLTIQKAATPPDSRRERPTVKRRLKGRWLLPGPATRRSVGLITSGEIPRVLLLAPVFGLVAALLWVRVYYEPPPQDMRIPVQVWRGILVVWAGVIALGGCYAFLAYLGRALAGREASYLYLQDQLWDATRGEQRRIQRWLARARLRGQKKEEGR